MRQKENCAMDLTNISVRDAGTIVFLGMAVVFAGLIMLMLVVQMMSRIMMRSNRKADAEEETIQTEQSAVATAAAPGTAGELKLYDTDPKDAAMVMAIVANNLGKPLNELRFLSIKEIKPEPALAKQE